MAVSIVFLSLNRFENVKMEKKKEELKQKKKTLKKEICEMSSKESTGKPKKKKNHFISMSSIKIHTL